MLKSAVRPDPDKLLVEIADYVTGYQIKKPGCLRHRTVCLMDTLACGFQALQYPACTK